MRKRIALIALCGATLAAPGAAASPRAEHALRRAESVLHGRSVRTGFEATPALRDLAVRYRALHGRDRRRARRLLARPISSGTRSGDIAYSVAAHDPPFCSAHFCIHWVDTSFDAPPLTSTLGDGVPDYIRTMDQVFEHVHAVENGQLGWREPRSDGRTGSQDDKVDVYVKDVGGEGIFGYSAPDPGQDGTSQHAYLVMDNDYAQGQFPRYASYLAPMEVTAAHEYNHVLQFSYDVYEDTWLMEATAVWMEDQVYDSVNDYVAYLGPWARMSRVPLTSFDELDQTDPLNTKVYGDAVFQRWLAERYGPALIRSVWERASGTIPEDLGVAAVDAALSARGSSFFDAFASFAPATAEWRTTGGPFADRDAALWPDMRRAAAPSLAPGRGSIGGDLDHTAYSLADVRPTADARIKLVGSLPRGTAGALALVGRVGSDTTGRVTLALTKLRHGGSGSVTLANPGRFSRITAVVVNADSEPGRFSPSTAQWTYDHDGQPVGAHVSNRFAPLRLEHAAPAAGAHVSRHARVVLRFSAPLDRASLRAIRLRDARGKRVRVRVRGSHGGRRVTLVPRGSLAAGARYAVQLGSAVMDRDANRLAARSHGWTFVTRR